MHIVVSAMLFVSRFSGRGRNPGDRAWEATLADGQADLHDLVGVDDNITLIRIADDGAQKGFLRKIVPLVVNGQVKVYRGIDWVNLTFNFNHVNKPVNNLSTDLSFDR